MAQCRFIKSKFQKGPISKEQAGRQLKATGAKKRVICWCEHPKHSPCDEAAAGYEFAGGKHLQCDGDRKKCPLTSTQFTDV